MDHSVTYTKFKLRHLPHIFRKNRLKYFISKMPKKIKNYSDFGCSNGYLTKIFSDILLNDKTFGFDNDIENIKLAKKKFPNMKFDYIDLNKINFFTNKSEVITCFETLEHVGSPLNAIKSLKNAAKNGSVILISVPIEIGFWGIFKYLINRFIYKYELKLNCNDYEYFFALITGRDISRYRDVKESYGAHFGFDYRKIDKIVNKVFLNSKILAFNKFTTRFYRIEFNQKSESFINK